MENDNNLYNGYGGTTEEEFRAKNVEKAMKQKIPTKKAAGTGGFSCYSRRRGTYLPPKSFRQLVQTFFPLYVVMSLESPQKIQAG